MGSKMSLHALGINPGPTASGPTVVPLVKNPGTDFGQINLMIRKAKAAKPLESSYLFEIFRLEESEFLSHATLYSSLVLGFNVCITTSGLYGSLVWLLGLKLCATTA